MSKHTEGNWIVRKGSTAGCEVVAPDAPKTRQRVAQCGGKDREANARLIAAAPALLGALEPFAKIAADGFKGTVYQDRPGETAVLQDHETGQTVTLSDFWRAIDAIGLLGGSHA